MNNTSNKQNNIFEQTVKTLTKDALLLQDKFHKLQESDNIKASIDTLRLLKDTLNLIKEYDWQLKYSEYRTDGHKEVAVWEQNHSGEIRNHKKWIVYEKDNDNNNALINLLEGYILQNKSYVSDNGDNIRGVEKSFSIAKLCDKYNGFVVSELKSGQRGIENNCKLFGFKVNFADYKECLFRQFANKILFIDEGSGLTDEQIEKLKETHIVIGFK